MNERSLQDLLAERRANVIEAAHETDPTARAMLEYHIAEIDEELTRRHPNTGVRRPSQRS